MEPLSRTVTDPHADGSKSVGRLGSADQASPRRFKPFVKWAGGKTRLLPQLLPHVPRQIVDYYEPFVGGGAMYFAVRSRVTGLCHLSDLNDELINAWIIVRDCPLDLLAALERYHDADSEAFYYEVRSASPAGDIARAARFIYLNQTAWNGLWRVNKLGDFNVPWGARSFRGLTAPQVEALQPALTNTTLAVSDFRTALMGAGPGDFVYLDPPYLPISDTSKFFFYTERRFRAPDLASLADLCTELTARGVAWVLSNRDTPVVRELFPTAHIVPLTARRSVAAQNRRDVEPSDSPEVIVVGDQSGSRAS